VVVAERFGAAGGCVGEAVVHDSTLAGQPQATSAIKRGDGGASPLVLPPGALSSARAIIRRVAKKNCAAGSHEKLCHEKFFYRTVEKRVSAWMGNMRRGSEV
jgi:hypothetical protein